MITTDTQRWLGGRDIRRPAGEPIRTSEYDVLPTMDPEVARAFIREHHYQGNPSSTAHRFPLYHRGELHGVALFGPPASENAHVAVWGDRLTQKTAVTLGRLVLLDEVPGNGESWFVARCFDYLRERGVLGVESCADPEPRADIHGQVTFRGHLGTVYQALNAHYVGRTLVSTLSLLPDGTCLSKRSQSKLRAGERGNTHPVAQLERWGADPLGDDEDAAAWLKRWRGKLCRTMRHHGCYRYLWSLSKRHRKSLLGSHVAQPYPKNDRGAA
jgi:hypothetical protein